LHYAGQTAPVQSNAIEIHFVPQEVAWNQILAVTKQGKMNTRVGRGSQNS
jgi:hypothetical protein